MTPNWKKSKKKPRPHKPRDTQKRPGICVWTTRPASGEHGDALAAEVDVVGHGVAGGIRFGEDFAAGAVPIELAAHLGDTTTVAVIQIVSGSHQT